MAGLQGLKARAAKDSTAALAETAEKFEGIFLQMMLKSMRKTTSGEGIFDSEQSRFYQDMFDDQIAQDLAKRGQVGIAEMLVRQLSPKESIEGKEKTAPVLDFERLRMRNIQSVLPTQALNDVKSIEPSNQKSQTLIFETPKQFVEQLWPMAEKHAATLGVKPEVLLAQAALETGWGKYVIKNREGGSSHSLFNIKADQRWSGESIEISTLEYRDGVARHEQAVFRAYPDFDASFADYAQFLQSGPRYQEALKNSADDVEFVRELHKAGYATDPEYPNKISRILAGEVFKDVVGGIKNAAVRPIT